jgi:hypothetical protein
MKTTLRKFVWALPIALFVVLLGRSADNSTHQTCRCLKAVYLKDGGQWHSLETVVDAAWEYLTSKTNVPAVERETFVVWIDRTETNQPTSIVFGAGIGKQFWEVRLGPTGQAQGYTTGSMANSHRTFGPRDK